MKKRNGFYKISEKTIFSGITGQMLLVNTLLDNKSLLKSKLYCCISGLSQFFHKENYKMKSNFQKQSFTRQKPLLQSPTTTITSLTSVILRKKNNEIGEDKC